MINSAIKTSVITLISLTLIGTAICITITMFKYSNFIDGVLFTALTIGLCNVVVNTAFNLLRKEILWNYIFKNVSAMR